MKWLTAKQVKKHATTSKRALGISIKHWQQIVDANTKEILNHPLTNIISTEMCGLCVYYLSCSHCPLTKVHRGCRSESHYKIVARVKNNYMEAVLEDHTQSFLLRNFTKKLVKC